MLITWISCNISDWKKNTLTPTVVNNTICTNSPNSALDVSGSITVSGSFIGSGNTLTNLNMSSVGSGTLSTLYGGTGCTSLNTSQFDTTGNILKINNIISSKWTASGTSIYYNIFI